MEKVCEYLYYNEKYQNQKDVPDMELPPELCLELLMAADFLGGTSVPKLRRPSRDICTVQIDGHHDSAACVASCGIRKYAYIQLTYR